ncbi:hypothetical protein LOTGIDRAFT_113919 [Lottia gigantea]|uniref:Lipase domain-containing protein n=1 Tax=Lottia gigantea TaxID=225164 RepID=V4AP07_LOTGI|nr:hypothetical protein LOTGIDRAFT_113919 [Lottia gigantea]ESO98917.1 hypothetical protein LOTGIDRAFT_113919 [Lottia gigantea]
MIVLLLVSAILVSVSANEKREQHCYGDLGCFQTWSELKTLPQDPAHVQTSFNLYTRQSKSPVVIAANASHSSWSKSISHSHFSASKPTKFLIHGFMNSKNSGWMPVTKAALIAQGDYNVFIVDWGHGAQLPYEQATANVFLVAKQTALFIQKLHSTAHVDLNNVHLIGHSLGAQICGNIGSHARGIGRITGMDPAQPMFDQFDNSRHLDASDAHFVDVIHSDGADFTGVAGYGWIKPLGHIDFYPNGGMDQPGCSDNPVGTVSCSHGRSHDYFLESIKSSCKFLAHKCKSWKDFENGDCHGCSGGCPQMGLNADKTKNLRGSYYLSTTQHTPFCGKIELF